MSALDDVLDVLPPTFAVDEGSVLRQLLTAPALELDAYAEDLDRLRRTHWFELAYRLVDLERLAALVGVARRTWETAPLFRSRVRALVDARLAGSVGPRAVQRFVYEAVRGTQEALGGVLVPGLTARIAAAATDPRDPKAVDAAFGPVDGQPGWRPLALAENPQRPARSAALAARGGAVPYLSRWTDTNHGLADAPVTVRVTGRSGGRTALPILANLTTGHALGYAGLLRVGQRLTVAPAADAGAGGRLARAVLDDAVDVTDRVFSLSGFALGHPFALDAADRPGPLVPLQARGPNDWIYLSAGLYGVPGLDATYFQIADQPLREGVFDETRFDESVFPAGVAAAVEVYWTESEPAAFAVVVPRGLVVLPAGGLADEIADGLAADLEQLHAVGVTARLELRPFIETQPQQTRVALPWIVVPPETGPAGEQVRVGVDGRFDESVFGRSRFE